MLFRTEGREKMIADRAYSRGLFASPDRLLYFAAAVPPLDSCTALLTSARSMWPRLRATRRTAS